MTCDQPCGGWLPPDRTRAAGRVEGDGIEVGFGLLNVGLTCGAFVVGSGHERADGELREGDGRDGRLVGKEPGGP
jgi:hypothetical protein